MLRHYRDEDYFEGGAAGYSSYEQQRPSLLKTFDHLLKQLDRRGFTGGDVLEVGCGFGYFLESASGLFDHRFGTEMAEAAAGRAREVADEVYVGGIEAVPSRMRFNLIVALHVLEHVYEPRQFLTELVGRLAAGGTLVVATPDMGSFWRRILGRRWPSFKYPEHVVFYDGDSLSGLLSSIPDLTDIREVPYPHAFPLSEVCDKVGLPAPGALRDASVWLPATTIAYSGRLREHDRPTEATGSQGTTE
jgi:SAM-dependent methyltransferase